jgi:hypothetical protein
VKISGRGEAARGAVWRVYERAKTREVRLEEARSCRQRAIRSTAGYGLGCPEKEAPVGKRGSRTCWIWVEASARGWRGRDGTTGWESRAEGRVDVDA